MANDRQITLAGDFKQSVNITNSLTNGESCSADDFGHAEGYKSHSHGKYSYAGGYSAYAKDNNSYVWSGKGSGSSYQSNGEGTYNIYTGSVNTDPLKYIYVDGSTIDSRISLTFSSVYLNTNLLSTPNTWSRKNTFSGAQNGGIVLNGVILSGDSNSGIELAKDSTATFYGTSKSITRQFEPGKNETGVSSLADIATTQYVKNAFAASLNSISTNYVKRGNVTTAIGSTSKPVYIDANGNAVAITDNVVFRGTSTAAGNNTQPIYMNGSSIIPSNATVGNTVTPMYMSGGTFTKLSGNVGNDGKSIVYLNAGAITKSTQTVGSSLRPVFLKNGSITPIGLKDDGTNFTFGGPKRPIYISNGVIALCETYSTGSGGGGGITSVSIDSGKTLVDNKFVTHLTSTTDANGAVKISANQVRPTIANVDGLVDKHTQFTNSLAGFKSSCNGFASSCSSLHTNIPLVYAPKFNPKVTGTGNVLSSVTFENNGASINLQKGITALTAAGLTGTGTVLTSLAISGSTVQGKLGYPPISVDYSGESDGNAINAISYLNGKITANKTKISTSGTSFTYSFESLGTLTSYGTNSQRSITTTKNGIIFIRISTAISTVHVAKITIGTLDFSIEVNVNRTQSFSWYAPKGTTITCWRGDTKSGDNPHIFNVYSLTFS